MSTEAIINIIKLFLIIAGVQYLGYLGVKLLGHRIGMLITGYAGGFVSSTAVFISLPGLLKERPDLTRSAIGSATMSILSNLTLIVMMILASVGFDTKLLLPIFAVMLVGAVATAITFKRSLSDKITPTFTNPLKLTSLLKLTAFIASILALIKYTRETFGSEAAEYVSFLAALFEVHGVVLANLNMYQLSAEHNADIKTSIFLAIFASMLSKLALIWALDRNTFAKKMTLIMTAMIVTGYLATLI